MEALTNPVVALTIVLVLSVIALIGAAVLGLDKGVLLNMGQRDFARGLITYLFAVVTIGTAAILVLSALTATGADVDHEKRFGEGKEILSLLLGIFGTIVGYYFGSESARRADSGSLRLSPIDLQPNTVETGGTVAVRATVFGGLPPYKFGIGVGDDLPTASEPVPGNGWVSKNVQLRTLKAGEPHVIKLTVVDSTGSNVGQTAAFQLAQSGTPG